MGRQIPLIRHTSRSCLGLILKLGASIALIHGSLFSEDKSSQSVEDIALELSSASLLGSLPLKGLSGFALHPLYSVKSSKMRALLYDEIADAFKLIGEVVFLSVPDVTGYGKADAFLTLQITDALIASEKKPLIVEISLSTSTTVTIDKTHERCSSYVWSSSILTQGKVQEKNIKNITSSLKAILMQFINEYRVNNPQQKEKPTFYLYKS